MDPMGYEWYNFLMNPRFQTWYFGKYFKKCSNVVFFYFGIPGSSIYVEFLPFGRFFGWKGTNFTPWSKKSPTGPTLGRSRYVSIELQKNTMFCPFFFWLPAENDVFLPIPNHPTHVFSRHHFFGFQEIFHQLDPPKSDQPSSCLKKIKPWVFFVYNR